MFWTSMKQPLENVIVIIIVLFKPHNFIIDTADDNDCNQDYRVPFRPLNCVQGEAEVFLHQDLHTEEQSEERMGENEKFRARLAMKIILLRYTRTNRPSLTTAMKRNDDHEK